jgi:hypothetical protein
MNNREFLLSLEDLRREREKWNSRRRSEIFGDDPEFYRERSISCSASGKASCLHEHAIHGSERDVLLKSGNNVHLLLQPPPSREINSNLKIERYYEGPFAQHFSVFFSFLCSMICPYFSIILNLEF